jgi:hypothetical protein
MGTRTTRVSSHIITFAAIDALQRFPLCQSLLEQVMEDQLLENAKNTTSGGDKFTAWRK